MSLEIRASEGPVLTGCMHLQYNVSACSLGRRVPSEGVMKAVVLRETRLLKVLALKES